MQRLGVSQLVSEAVSNKSYSWRSWLARQMAIRRQGYRRLNAFHFAPAIGQLVPDRRSKRLPRCSRSRGKWHHLMGFETRQSSGHR